MYREQRETVFQAGMGLWSTDLEQTSIRRQCDVQQDLSGETARQRRSAICQTNLETDS